MSNKVKALMTKVKTFILSIWNRIKPFKEIVIACVIFFLVFMLISMYANKLDKRVKILEAENTIKAEQLRVIEIEKTNICHQLKLLIEKQNALQKRNDNHIKEAGQLEYKKTLEMSDTDVLDSLNALIESASKRNSD